MPAVQGARQARHPADGRSRAGGASQQQAGGEEAWALGRRASGAAQGPLPPVASPAALVAASWAPRRRTKEVGVALLVGGGPVDEHGEEAPGRLAARMRGRERGKVVAQAGQACGARALSRHLGGGHGRCGRHAVPAGPPQPKPRVLGPSHLNGAATAKQTQALGCSVAQPLALQEAAMSAPSTVPPYTGSRHSGPAAQLVGN